MYNLICSTSSCLFIINWFVLITLHFVLLCSNVCVNIPVMKHSTAASLSLSLFLDTCSWDFGDCLMTEIKHITLILQ